jgi:hypothetical protein
MDDLLKWCHEGDGVEARLYLGAGGEGKTRFFAQACSLLMNGDYGKWQAGWLDLRRWLRGNPLAWTRSSVSTVGLLLGIDLRARKSRGAITVGEPDSFRRSESKDTSRSFGAGKRLLVGMDEVRKRGVCPGKRDSS